MNNDKLLMNFARITYMPDTESAEFINVGVVASCPETGWFQYRIEIEPTDRARAFFPDLHERHMRLTLGGMAHRLNMLVSSAGPVVSDGHLPMMRRQKFEQLLGLPTTAVYLTGWCSAMTTDPDALLDELHERMVLRRCKPAMLEPAKG